MYPRLARACSSLLACRAPTGGPAIFSGLSLEARHLAVTTAGFSPVRREGSGAAGGPGWKRKGKGAWFRDEGNGKAFDSKGKQSRAETRPGGGTPKRINGVET